MIASPGDQLLTRCPLHSFDRQKTEERAFRLKLTGRHVSCNSNAITENCPVSMVSFAITSAENPGIGGGLNADGSINQPSGLIIDDSVFGGEGPFFEATPGTNS